MSRSKVLTRSEIMRSVASKNTQPELALRKALWRAGVRGWRVNLKTLDGKPDIVFGRAKVAVFVDGCFWHGCPDCYRAPKGNAEYWQAKVARNRLRDALVTARLRANRWRVLRFWEHELRLDLVGCVEKVRTAISDRQKC